MILIRRHVRIDDVGRAFKWKNFSLQGMYNSRLWYPKCPLDGMLFGRTYAYPLLCLLFNCYLLNKLSLNTKKTIFMTFGNYRDSVPTEISIMIHNQKIERVESCKYLGVFFDYNMKWDKHIEYMVNRTIVHCATREEN